MDPKVAGGGNHQDNSVIFTALLSMNAQAAQEAAACDCEGRHSRCFYLEVRNPRPLLLPRRLLHGLFKDTMPEARRFPQVP